MSLTETLLKIDENYRPEVLWTAALPKHEGFYAVVKLQPPEGKGRTYKVLADGTYYHQDTPDEVVVALQQLRRSGERARIWNGDTKTGLAWQDEWQAIGRIGRSTGWSKIPLLILTRRSTGGPGLLDHCIVAIRVGLTDWRYQHPLFHLPRYEVVPEVDPKLNADGYTHSVRIHKDDAAPETAARFRSEAKANRWVEFMSGRSNRK